MLISAVSPAFGTTISILSPGRPESGGTTTVFTVLDLPPGLSLNLFSKEQRQPPVVTTFFSVSPSVMVAVWRRLTCDGRNAPSPGTALLLTPTFASCL
jgi:hypothetical protein